MLDLGCGKAEALRRVVERYDAHGVGVDLSPVRHVAQARAASMELRKGTLELIEGDALQYAPSRAVRRRAGAGSGLGARQLRALIRQIYPHAVPGGLLLLADGYLAHRANGRVPGPARRQARGDGQPRRATCGPPSSSAWRRCGRQPPRQRDWDRYEWRYLATVERWAAEHEADPQRAGFLERARAGRDRYLGGGREQLGFGIYLFRVPR